MWMQMQLLGWHFKSNIGHKSKIEKEKSTQTDRQTDRQTDSQSVTKNIEQVKLASVMEVS